MKTQNKTVSGLIWSFTQNVGTQGITFVFSVILARLLTPADFGLVAMLSVFIALSNTFIDNGFSAALIQQKKPTQVDYSTVFFLKIGLSIVFYFIFHFSLPYIASFYNQPQLTNIGKVLGLVFVIKSLAGVHHTILTKRLEFKSLAIRSFIVSILSGLVGISFAYNGYGVWSLVYKKLTFSIISAIVIWPLAKWQPKFVFSVSSIRKLSKYGTNMMISGVLNTTFNETMKVVVGKLFGATELGFYQKARSLRDTVSNKINATFIRVLFPAFSLKQDNPEALIRGNKKAIQIQSFITFPLLTIMIVFVEPIVRVLLTEKWLEMVPYLQLLCLVHFISPINTINKNTMKVMGRSDIYLKTEIIRKALFVGNIIISYRYGVVGLLIGLNIVSWINTFINAYYSYALLKYRFIDQLKHSSGILNFCIVSAGIGFLLSMLFESDLGIVLLVLPLTVLLYLTLCFVFKIEAFMLILNLINEKQKSMINKH